jgi:hypothetical protein
LIENILWGLGLQYTKIIEAAGHHNNKGVFYGRDAFEFMMG